MQGKVYLTKEQIKSYNFEIKTSNNHTIKLVLTDVSDESVGPEYEYIAHDELGYKCWYSYNDYDLFMHTEKEIMHWQQELKTLFATSFLNYQIRITQVGNTFMHKYASSLSVIEEFFMPHPGTVWINLKKQDVLNLL